MTRLGSIQVLTSFSVCFSFLLGSLQELGQPVSVVHATVVFGKCGVGDAEPCVVLITLPFRPVTRPFLDKVALIS